MSPNILIIEDEPKVAQAIQTGFASEGWNSFIAVTGEEGFFEISAHHYDAVVLDIMLPGRNGLEILATLRASDHWTPVIILTAKDTIADRVSGLEAGADDYLIKPFSFAELVARVRALLRRGAVVERETSFSVGDLKFDALTRHTTRDGKPIPLTPRETDLLLFLLRNRDRIVTREMLARSVWRETERATPIDNVIDVHIAHLRKKIDGPFSQKLLHTVRGVGFRLAEEGG